MANITPTITKVGSKDGGGVAGYVVVWADMSTSDVGLTADAADLSLKDLLGASDRSVQVEGTFAAGTMTIQGCNEVSPTNWRTLNDPQGNALTFTSERIEQLLENTLYVRPSMSAHASTLTVTLVMRRKG